MRRLIVAAALACALAASTACKRGARHSSGDSADLLSVVPAGDPAANAQLISGFYSPEGEGWRWTAGKFRAELKPPPGSGQDGARLELKLNIPDVAFQKLGAITLSASAGGMRLTPEKFTETGNHVYAAAVPPEALRSDRVTIEFATDKVIPAGTIEKRELALIVTSVGLVPK
jgi:hypothetical protein